MKSIVEENIRRRLGIAFDQFVDYSQLFDESNQFLGALRTVWTALDQEALSPLALNDAPHAIGLFD